MKATAVTTLTTDLPTILRPVRQPGRFYAAGVTELYAPHLTVDGVGTLALPLLPAQAEQLIAVAERAPYGRGERTLVDTKVRRTWQISPSHLRIGGRHWPRTLDTVIARCRQQLGVSAPVTAEFYKLLIYDTGSFFVSHRDTEKTPGMFATLIIALPAEYTGGELLLRHRDQQVRLDVRTTDPSEVSFAAFYADCVHEIRPIRSGYRLALVYNLVRKGRGELPQAPHYDAEQARLAKLLQQWGSAERHQEDENPAPEKLVYPLEHAYTPAALAFDALKGADAAAAAAASRAAEQADCDLHLALLEIEESGSAEYDGYSGWRRGRRARYQHQDADDFEIIEVHERRQTLSHWQRPDGKAAEWQALPFFDKELCPPDGLGDGEPDELHFHEATGNEGASFERTYRRAALVFWPRARRLAVLNQAGLPATLPYLDSLVTAWRKARQQAKSRLWQQADELARQMIDTWPARHRRFYPDDTASDSVRMLALLTQLKAVGHVDRFLCTVSAQGNYTKDDNPAIVTAFALIDRPRAAEVVEKIITANAGTHLDGAAELLQRCAVTEPFSAKPAALGTAADALLRSLPGDPARTSDVPSWRRSTITAAIIVDVLQGSARVDRKLADRAADYILAWPKTYSLDTVVLPAVLALAGVKPALKAVQRLRKVCLTHLQTRIAEPLAPPGDWRRDHQLNCRCDYCRKLSQFLVNPERQVWTLKAAERHRRHVSDTIRSNRCDLDIRTAKHTRPYELVCTKNQASYERRSQQRRQDLKNASALKNRA